MLCIFSVVWLRLLSDCCVSLWFGCVCCLMLCISLWFGCVCCLMLCISLWFGLRLLSDVVYLCGLVVSVV